MALPTVVAVTDGSPAAAAGVLPGDELVAIDGRAPRDVIEYRFLADEPDIELELRRGGMDLVLPVAKDAGEALGVEVSSAVFDRIRTCDNHCSFCFIYQLPAGMRKSLYVKDDDYRLSFLYGNFTTLTRFTEVDLERIVTEGLSPLYVSIHATDPEVRARLLRNRRGATSLRWLRALLDAGVTVHGQIVVCPGENDGAVLDDTFAGILDRYPELETVASVPLGVSRHSSEPGLRPHTPGEAATVVDQVAAWQQVFLRAVGRRVVFAADEYHLLAGRPFPPADEYEGFAQHENGIGMVRALEAEWAGGGAVRSTGGFFQAVDGAPAEGYRAERTPGAETSVSTSVSLGRRPTRRDDRPVGILTGTYGAAVLAPLVASTGRDDVRIVAVHNEFFGGNIAVAGLLVGEDLSRALADEPVGDRYLLPDVCLSGGRFLDGTSPDDLPRPVEIVATDGGALRAALAS